MTQSVEPILAAIPWNRSRFRGQKPPLKPKQIWGIRARLQICKRFRDLALFELALDSKLRGCDLVRVKVSDVALNGVVRSRATVIQRKTDRPVQFEPHRANAHIPSCLVTETRQMCRRVSLPEST